MTTYNIQDANREIIKRLKNIFGSSYFTLELDNEDIKIRVSDHSAKHSNNSGKTLSFCTNFAKHQDCNPMINEWVVDENGDLDEEFKNVLEVLEWELN